MAEKDYGRKWTKDIDDFLRANVPCKSKKELLEKVNSHFGTNFTLHALTTNMCVKKIHAQIKPWQNDCGLFRGRAPLPIGSESQKKGYVRIKVAQPNVWKQKQVYLYEQAHNVEVDTHTQAVIFLDGNNKNFAIENLYLLDRKHIVQFNYMSKKSDSIETKKLIIDIIKLKHERLNLLEATGSLVKTKSSYRYYPEDKKEWYREKMASMSEEEKAERRKYNADRQRERLHRLKEIAPDRYRAILDRTNSHRRKKK